MDFIACQFEKVTAKLDQIEKTHKEYTQQNNVTNKIAETKIG